ncbi:SAP30-binding protein-like [Watersipora subatra]|uniref:SAP30-binding protein-like n=1 Tax=Watersipora subatra TaxID=2589382 RepID=UPI00355ADBF6
MTSDSSSQKILGSLAGYAMSESDEEAGDLHKLSGTISGSDDEGSSHSPAPSRPSRTYSPVIKDDQSIEKRKTPVSSLGLVSYGGQDDDDEEEESDREPKESESEEDEIKSASSAELQESDDKGVVDYDKTFTTEDLVQSSANASPSQVESLDVQIPPSPPGSPPKSLIENIARICKRGQGCLDASIASRKEFRNPSIYEKLLSHLGVDEKGTNYPPELYDPSIWDKSSFYDELAKLQNIEMEKRKAEKKDRVKVDFITATKPTSAAHTDSSEPGNKKTKWDNASQQAANVTSAPPVGSLIKRK